jgi:hypothetical protein
MDDQRRHRRLTLAPSREPSSFYDQRRGASSCHGSGQVVGVKSAAIPCMTSSSLKFDGSSSFWKFWATMNDPTKRSKRR